MNPNQDLFKQVLGNSQQEQLEFLQTKLNQSNVIVQFTVEFDNFNNIFKITPISTWVSETKFNWNTTSSKLRKYLGFEIQNESSFKLNRISINKIFTIITRY